MNRLGKFLIGVTLLLMTSLSFAEPTLDQVYSAAKSGHLAEARSMMQEVVRLHPNSAKAHYVNAEVLARSGDLSTAQSELTIAEKLEPGLPFANPQSVSALRQELFKASSVGHPVQRDTGTSWGTILVIGLIALFVVIWLVRRLTQQNPVVVSQGPSNGYYPNGMPMGGGQPMYPSGGGGSGLMGSLATGAALGAGMVAGEALAHRLVDGPSTNSGAVAGDGFASNPNVNGDMGGQDFGVSDNSSWNDSSSSSWDSGDLGGGMDSGGGSDWT